jgi:biotin carboxylase
LGAVVEAARAWAAEQPFDGVLAIHESSVIPGAAVAEALGLPGHTLEAARNSRNKYLMRQCHRAGGAPCPDFALAGELATARAIAGRMGFPLILKPTLGAGSEHVYRIDSMTELEEIFPLARRGIDTHSDALAEVSGVDLGPHSLLLESFLDGSEHSMEAVLWDGEVRLGSVADRLSKELQTFDHDLYSMPTALAPEQLDRVREAVRLGALAQGIRRGVLHAEVRFRHGEPHLLEIAARIGGGSLFRMARIAYGYCPLWAAYRISLGIRPAFGELARTGEVTVGLTMLCDGGRLVSIETPEEILQDPRIFNYRIVPHLGDVIQRPPHGNDVLGYLGATGSSIEAAVETAMRAFAQVRVELAPCH